MNIVMVLAICLLITIVSETLFSLIIGIRRLDLLFVLLVNILTNPLLNTILNYVDLMYSNQIRLITFIVGEIFVFVIEGIIYSKCLDNKKINPYILSLILNVFSMTIGLLLDRFIW